MSKQKELSRVELIKAKQQALYNAYYAKRTNKDMDLTIIVANLIGEQIGEEYKEAFLNDPAVLIIRDRLPGVQRVILNKYFAITLLRYSGITGNSVFNIVSYAIFNDGTHEDWFKWLGSQVMPFCKEFNVFEIIYPNIKKEEV